MREDPDLGKMTAMVFVYRSASFWFWLDKSELNKIFRILLCKSIRPRFNSELRLLVIFLGLKTLVFVQWFS